VFSPDAKRLCVAQGGSIHLISAAEATPLPIDLPSPVTAIATVSPSPWLICAGLETGELVFFEETRPSAHFKCTPYKAAVQRLHACRYRGGHFTQPGDLFLAQYGDGRIAIFAIRDIAPEPKFDRWTISHKSPADSVVIFSKFKPQSFSMGSSLGASPAVFSVGSNPFLSVVSIVKAPPASGIGKVFSRLASWVAPPSEDDVQEARLEWQLNDEPREAREAAASEDGRWLAVPDCQGRVSIIDCIFGHFTRILKGMRDAQVAWSHSNCLLIFAPARGLIVACTVPMGEIFDAVKVDRRGQLFQCMKEGNELQAVFMDADGNFGEISVEPPAKGATE
jgi:hypothetical protein